MVIGDPHAHPRYDNDRFEELGAYARVLDVDHIHCVGDWTDFPSLNEHKSKKDQRPDLYQDDLDAGVDALGRFADGLEGYDVPMTITLGNHDTYPERWVADNPKFEGTISVGDVPFEEYGWKTTPFLETARIRGILCSHYFSSGATGRAQAGIHVAYSNGTKQGENCLVGHNHRFDHNVRTYGSGRKVHAFSAGCMNHPRYAEGWCANTKHLWDRGVLMVETDRGQVRAFSWTDYRTMRRSL